MKKSLLLAALLLSSAAQAETYVCSTPVLDLGFDDNRSNLHTLARQDQHFAYTLKVPDPLLGPIGPSPLEVLTETDAMLTLMEKGDDGTYVRILMINKITYDFVTDSIRFSRESFYGRETGSCVKV